VAALLVYVFVGDDAWTLLMLTVPWPLFAFELVLVCIGRERVLFRGTVVYSLPLLTQPLLLDEGTLAFVATDYCAGASPFYRAWAAMVFLVPSLTVR